MIVRLVERVGTVVISVDYTLSPEVPFKHAIHQIEKVVHLVYDERYDLGFALHFVGWLTRLFQLQGPPSGPDENCDDRRQCRRQSNGGGGTACLASKAHLTVQGEEKAFFQQRLSKSVRVFDCFLDFILE